MDSAGGSQAAERQPVVVLSQADVRRLLTVGECVAAVEEAFRLYGEEAVPAPGILGMHVAGGGFHIKAGALPWEGRLYFAAKTNANFPGNRSKWGLPTIQGVVLLFDAERGMPLAIMDSMEITALRTGAASAVAAKYLARPESSVLTMIGCGLQSRLQLASLLEVLPIRTVYAYDREHQRALDFAARFAADDAGQSGRVAAQAVSDFAGVARRSDVIVTCTTAKSAFLTREHVSPGAFVAAVGSDNEDKQELDPQLLVHSRVIPDVLAQAAKIGELHHAIAGGFLKEDSLPGDLGKVVAGKIPGRITPEEITIFDSTGMALQDVAAACALYKKALAAGHLATVTLSD